MTWMTAPFKPPSSLLVYLRFSDDNAPKTGYNCVRLDPCFRVRAWDTPTAAHGEKRPDAYLRFFCNLRSYSFFAFECVFRTAMFSTMFKMLAKFSVDWPRRLIEIPNH